MTDDPTEPADALPDAPADPGFAADPRAIVEALLFVSDGPLTAAKLREAGGLTGEEVRAALEELRAEFDGPGRAFALREVAGGWLLSTKPAFDPYIARLFQVKTRNRLSAPALETLAIVAYRQPITRAEIDSIRGVNSGALLKALMEKGLVRIAGRGDALGRPMLYGTTEKFLETFGLKSPKDLPRLEELK